MDGLTEGRIVHLILTNGLHRPAIVTEVVDKEKGKVNLNVQLSPTDALWSSGQPVISYQNIEYGENKILTWHWIEPA